jgi:hypothetical protein
MTVSCTALLPYWPQAFSAVLCGLRKLIIGCSTQTASGDLPTTLEQEDSNVQTRRANAAERSVTPNVLVLIRKTRVGAGEGNRTLV